MMRRTSHFLQMHTGDYHPLPKLLRYVFFFPIRAVLLIRGTHADKYNVDYMHSDIKNMENQCIALRQQAYEQNLRQIPRIRSQQKAKIDELQAMQCLLYDSLNKIRHQIKELEDEMAKEAL